MSNVDMEGQLSPVMRGIAKIELRNALTVLVVMGGIWGVLSGVLPDGWWHLPINLAFFLFTAAGAVAIRGSLQALGVPGWLAFALSMLVWLVLVVVVRSVILSVL